MLHAEGAYPYRGAAKHRAARRLHAGFRLGAVVALVKRAACCHPLGESPRAM
jgi:hypothetical protein